MLYIFVCFCCCNIGLYVLLFLVVILCVFLFLVVSYIMHVCCYFVLYAFIPLIRKNGFGRLPEVTLSINQSIAEEAE